MSFTLTIDGSDITGYKIQRSISSWVDVVNNTANTGSPDTTYSDTELSSNTTYMYRVYAINVAGISPPSDAASATTLALLSVISVDALGNPLNGVWLELHSVDGIVIVQGYSPITFDVV